MVGRGGRGGWVPPPGINPLGEKGFGQQKFLCFLLYPKDFCEGEMDFLMGFCRECLGPCTPIITPLNKKQKALLIFFLFWGLSFWGKTILFLGEKKNLKYH